MCILIGSVAEWSKALVLGTSLFGGASSNLAAIKYLHIFYDLEKFHNKKHSQ